MGSENSCHCKCPASFHFIVDLVLKLAYLKDINAAAHSVDAVAWVCFHVLY